ncbi:hypothetical protein OIV83_000351 [Microbotryomycetes sp. JL201]|nr:hypothetical protein OIV83_000351 [Microbotryomycetes sp. JL201]
MVPPRLARWLQENNVRWHNAIDFVPEVGGSCAGVGIVARAGFAPDMVRKSPSCGRFVSIPKTAVLSVRSSALSGTALDSLPSTSPALLLSTCLVYEMQLGPASRWHAYVESLGQEAPPIAALWPRHGEARAWAAGTQLERELQRAGVDAETIATFFEQHAEPLLVRASEKLSISATFALQDFLRAYSFVSSRAFVVDSWHGLSLVPLADIFNHSDTPHVNLESDIWVCPLCGSLAECAHDDEVIDGVRIMDRPLQDDCLMVTTRTIRTGEEIFNTYGALSNAELLAHYGFLLDGNACDVVSIEPAFVFRQFWSDETLDAVASDYIDDCTRLLRGLLSQRSADSQDLPSSLVHLEPPNAAHGLFSIDADATLSLQLWVAVVLGSQRTAPGSEPLRVAEDVDFLHDAWLCAESLHETIACFEGFRLDAHHVRAIAAEITRLCRRRLERQRCCPDSASSIFDKAEVGRPLYCARQK